MKTLILSLSVLFSSLAMAHHFGDAGCGLGSQVMGAKENQVLAATTNASSYTQLFGITSGTSNCTDEGAVKKDKSVSMYIEVNRAELAKESARGQGETLAGLANLMGCNPNNFGTQMKSNYDKIFVDTQMQPSGIENSVRTMVNTNKAKACGA